MRLNPIALGISIMALAAASAHAQDAQTRANAQPQSSQQSTQQGSLQQQPTQHSSMQGSAQQPSMQKTVRASELMDRNVVDKQGRNLGHIDEIVIDLNSGKAHAAVLSVGGFLGIGDKHVALPMGEITRGEGGKFTADLDRKKLEDAEGFAKGQMPGMDDEYWARTTSTDRGQSSDSTGSQATPTRGGISQGMNLVRASEMDGREVQDRSGNAVGEVRDVLLSATDAKIEHFVVAVKDAGEVLIKPDAFSSGIGDRLVVNESREQLASQATAPREQRQAIRSQPAQPSTSQGQRTGG